MALEAGTRLGHYEIVSSLGAGGMGEVYRAKDLELGREVAIKVLPEAFSEEPERMDRFEREAKILAGLNHTNIATLYSFEADGSIRFLVMEVVEGETLEERLKKGALRIAQVLEIGGQIAAAIDAAHKAEVVHRDLKPSNVMLTKSGVKVLDFGLAKSIEAGPLAANTQSPTMMQPITGQGSIVGTPLYMAPEQLEGKDTDARTDIWALGCVLYEMVSGERPFRGENHASLTTAIMASEPRPLSVVQAIAPPRLDWVVSRCLAKDPERRWQSARDVSIELEALLQGDGMGGGMERPPGATSQRLRTTAWIASILATAALTSLAVGLLDQRSPAPVFEPETELRIRQLTGRPSSDTVQTSALSPDGEQLAFATREGLFLQLVETGEERLLPLPDELQVLEVDWLGATNLLFSASTGNAFGLYKTSIFGGATRKLTDGAWRAAVTPDGSRIAFLKGVPSRIVTVSGPDGEGSRTVLDLGGKGAVWELAWSPDGRWLLVGVWGGATNPFDTVLEAIEIGTGVRKKVLTDPRFFQAWRGFLPFLWTADDRLVVGRREPSPNLSTANLWHVTIDRSTAAVEGDLVRLTQLTGANPKDLSATADGQRIAFLQERSQSDVLVAKLEEGGRQLGEVHHLTVDQRDDHPLAWSRDGNMLFFESGRTGTPRVFRAALDSSTAAFVAEKDGGTHFMEVSRDDSAVLFWRRSELVRVPAAGGPAETLLEAGIWPGIGCNAASDRCLVGERSPDGLTYVFSDFDAETGRGDVVLRIEDRPPFTNWDVSPDGSLLVVAHNDDRLRIFDLATGEETVLTHEGLSYGEFPAWSADGSGLFVDGGYASRGRLQRGLLYISLDDGDVHVLRQNWGEWNTHLVPSVDGERLAFSANYFYDANAWMIEGF